MRGLLVVLFRTLGQRQLKDNKIMMFKGHTQREYAPIAEVNG